MCDEIPLTKTTMVLRIYESLWPQRKRDKTHTRKIGPLGGRKNRNTKMQGKFQPQPDVIVGQEISRDFQLTDIYGLSFPS